LISAGGRELTALPRPSRGLGYFLGKGGRKDWREGQGIEGENGGDLLLRQGEEKRGVEGYPQTQKPNLANDRD